MLFGHFQMLRQSDYNVVAIGDGAYSSVAPVLRSLRQAIPQLSFRFRQALFMPSQVFFFVFFFYIPVMGAAQRAF